MPRHFFLRDPRTNFPTTCVATSIDTPRAEASESIIVKFAVSTYNPVDAKLGLPYDRRTAINRATGRLLSKHHLHILSVPPATPYAPGRNVKALICAEISTGTWRSLHPRARSAHIAAAHWLKLVTTKRAADVAHVQAPATSLISSSERELAALAGDEQPEPSTPTSLDEARAIAYEGTITIPVVIPAQDEATEEVIDHELDRMAGEGGVAHELHHTQPIVLTTDHADDLNPITEPTTPEPAPFPIEQHDAMMDRLFGPRHVEIKWP